MKGKVICFAIAAALVSSLSQGQSESSRLNVVIIAPSISTSMEARSALLKLGWNETKNYRTAHGMFVVVRSALYNPLSFSYDNICELKEDAEGQLNIAGMNFHLYLYSIEDDLSARQLKHISYEAD